MVPGVRTKSGENKPITPEDNLDGVTNIQIVN
jgi:hypothetical protein